VDSDREFTDKVDSDRDTTDKVDSDREFTDKVDSDQEFTAKVDLDREFTAIVVSDRVFMGKVDLGDKEGLDTSAMFMADSDKVVSARADSVTEVMDKELSAEPGVIQVVPPADFGARLLRGKHSAVRITVRLPSTL